MTGVQTCALPIYPVAIQWEVRNEGQGPRIVDVKSEGVSMIMTRRADFISYIRNHGGQVESLIDELEARAKRSTTAQTR